MDIVLRNAKVCADNLEAEKSGNNILYDILRNWNLVPLMIELCFIERYV
jgi:hypothetical protein